MSDTGDHTRAISRRKSHRIVQYHYCLRDRNYWKGQTTRRDIYNIILAKRFSDTHISPYVIRTAELLRPAECQVGFEHLSSIHDRPNSNRAQSCRCNIIKLFKDVRRPDTSESASAATVTSFTAVRPDHTRDRTCHTRIALSRDKMALNHHYIKPQFIWTMSRKTRC